VSFNKLTLLIFTFFFVFLFSACLIDENGDNDEKPVPADLIALNNALKTLKSAERYEVVLTQKMDDTIIFDLTYVFTDEAIHILSSNLIQKPFYIVLDDPVYYCFDKTGLKNYVCQFEAIIGFEDFQLDILFLNLELDMFKNESNIFILHLEYEDVLDYLPLFDVEIHELIEFNITIDRNNITLRYNFKDADELIYTVSMVIRKINTATISLPDFFNQLQLETLINPILAASSYTISYRRNGVDHLGQFADVQFIKSANNYNYVWRQFTGPPTETYFKQDGDDWFYCMNLPQVGWHCRPCPLNNPYKNHLDHYRLDEMDLSWFNPFGQTFVLNEAYYDEMSSLVSHLVPKLSLDTVVIRPTNQGTEIQFRFVDPRNHNIFENIVIVIYDLDETVIVLPFVVE
jgi:hypothetical protein